MRPIKTGLITPLVNSYFIDSPLPSNISYMWNFGSLLGVCLMIQIITGVTLAMHYTCHVDMAFASVEHIMRNVNAGWIIRYGHANGATMFLFIIYLHIARGLYYGSYTKPRVALWTVGVIIFLLVMGTACLGLIGQIWLLSDYINIPQVLSDNLFFNKVVGHPCRFPILYL